MQALGQKCTKIGDAGYVTDINLRPEIFVIVVSLLCNIVLYCLIEPIERDELTTIFISEQQTKCDWFKMSSIIKRVLNVGNVHLPVPFKLLCKWKLYSKAFGAIGREKIYVAITGECDLELVFLRHLWESTC